jgi:hypothetical protein
MSVAGSSFATVHAIAPGDRASKIRQALLLPGQRRVFRALGIAERNTALALLELWQRMGAHPSFRIKSTVADLAELFCCSTRHVQRTVNGLAKTHRLLEKSDTLDGIVIDLGPLLAAALLSEKHGEADGARVQPALPRE